MKFELPDSTNTSAPDALWLLYGSANSPRQKKLLRKRVLEHGVRDTFWEEETVMGPNILVESFGTLPGSRTSSNRPR